MKNNRLSMKKIPLSQGLFAVIDEIDFDWLNNWKWSAHKSKNVYYAERHGNIKMHRVIMERILVELKNFELLNKFKKHPMLYQIDHVDGNGLNNIRNNLRIVTNRVNSQNKHVEMTSCFPGVSWADHAEKWRARIQVDGKYKHLGYFVDEKKAYLTYQHAVKQVEKGLSFDEISVHSAKFSSNYRGVTWHKASNKWHAQIYINGKKKYLGSFTDEFEAHLTVEEAREKFLK